MTTATTTRRLVVTHPPVPRILHPNGRTMNHRWKWSEFWRVKADAKTATLEVMGRWRPATGSIKAVTITRRFYVPDRRNRDIDNLEASTKAISDGTAAALNCNDSIFRWLPSEVIVERGRREVCFEIEIAL